MKRQYVIGIDYGSDSCRTIVSDVLTGNSIAEAECDYPRWKSGKFCDYAKKCYRQHPLDYIESLEISVKNALASCPSDVVDHIVGIAFDTTGSTPVMVDESGTPLALLPEFSENPNAMFILWKDHTAMKEADEINSVAHRWVIDYTKYSGGTYSSEWFWAKALHVLRSDEAVRRRAYSVVEHCDWMPALLTGVTHSKQIKRNRCAAGHKAMWHEEWGGLPSQEFLSAVDPLLDGYRSRLYDETVTSDTFVGYVTTEWCERLGLPHKVMVSAGVIDAHAGAIGVGIQERNMVCIMGTSTCDIVVAPYDEINNRCIDGICGQVDGSVIPGMVGIEAGQSAFGDIYAWFGKLFLWPESLKCKSVDSKSIGKIISLLDEEASKLPLTAEDMVATDWFNGRRSPHVNMQLRASIWGLTLATTVSSLYKSLVEASAFGTRSIVEDIRRNGIKIDVIIGVGGISLKSPYVMQVLADVLGMEIRVSASRQACALGAAMLATTSAGIYPSLHVAQKMMSSGYAVIYKPNMDRHEIYTGLYLKYKEIGDFTSSL